MVQAHQQDIARRVVGAEHGVAEQVGPGFTVQGRGNRLAAEVQAGQLVVQQVFVFRAGLVGRYHHQPGQRQPERNGQTGGEFGRSGQQRRGGITQGQQQAGLDAGEHLPALSIVLGTLNLATQSKPLLGPALQALVGGAMGFVAGVSGFRGRPGGGLGGIPAFQASLDVALEDFGEVMVAVELIFVGNASEGLDGFKNGHGQAPTTAWGWHTPASTCIQGWGSVVRVSCTHWR